MPLAATEIGYVCNVDGGPLAGCAVMGDGSGPHVLFTSASKEGAVLSPDGERAAYTSDLSQENYFVNGGLWIANADGTDNRQLAGAATFGCSGSGPSGTDTADSCGNTPEPGQPAWRPDGTEIAVAEPTHIDTTQSSYPGNCQIWIVNSQGGPARVLRDTAGRPLSCSGTALAWSPDGNDIAYAAKTGLVKVRATGGDPIRLASLPDDDQIYLQSLSWSPNDATILLSLAQGDVETVPSSGGKPKTLFRSTPPPPVQSTATTAPASALVPAETSVPPTGATTKTAAARHTFAGSSGCPRGGSVDYSGAYYSPDGTHIVVGKTRYACPSDARLVFPDLGTCRLETTEPDGSQLTDISSYPSLCNPTGWVRTPSDQISRLYASSPGYAEVTAGGEVADFGSATFPPLTGITGLRKPVVAAVPVGMVSDLLVSADGSFYGPGGKLVSSLPAPPSAPIVAAPNSLTLVASDGTEYYESRPSRPALIPYSTAGPVVAAVYADGGRDTMVTARGVVASQGYQTSRPVNAEATAPIIGIALDDATGGYWLAASDGRVYGIGAPLASPGPVTAVRAPIVDIAADDATGGYWLLGQDGTVYGFNAPVERPHHGQHLESPAVAIMRQPGPPPDGLTPNLVEG